VRSYFDQYQRRQDKVHPEQYDFMQFPGPVIDLDRVKAFLDLVKSRAGDVKWVPPLSDSFEHETHLAEITLPVAMNEAVSEGEQEMADLLLRQAEMYLGSAHESSLAIATLDHRAKGEPTASHIWGDNRVRRLIAEHIVGWDILSGASRNGTQADMPDSARDEVIGSVSYFLELYDQSAMKFLYSEVKDNARRRLSGWSSQLEEVYGHPTRALAAVHSGVGWIDCSNIFNVIKRRYKRTS
jgi:hypothetical protein